MSSKSEIYAINSTIGSSLPAGSVYAPTTIVRRFGRYTNLASNGIVLGSDCDCKGSRGYYNIDTTLTVTPTGAGTLTATLYEDGVAIPGAVAIETVTSGDVVSITIPRCAVRLRCGGQQPVITVVLSGVDTTSSNLAILVEKV